MAGRVQVPMTAVEERRIVEALNDGAGWHAVAKQFHRCGSTIAAIAAKHGIPSRVQIWNADEEDYLRAHYADESTVGLAKRLGRPLHKVYNKAKRMGLEKSAAYLASPAACRLRRGDNVGAASRFQKDHVPANKGLRRPGYSIGRGRMQETQFKKGVRSGVAVKLWKPIGTERISKDGYLERKINNGLPLQRRWRAVHLIIWEKEHGPLPEGYALVFKNGDRADIRLDNLELITRADLMRRNTIHNLPPELKGVLQLKAQLNRAITMKEKTNAEKESGRSAESPLRHDRAAQG